MAITVVSRTVAFMDYYSGSPPAGNVPSRVISCGSVSAGDSVVISIVEPFGLSTNSNFPPTDSLGNTYTFLEHEWSELSPLNNGNAIYYLPYLPSGGTLTVTVTNLNNAYAIAVIVLSKPVALYSRNRAGYPKNSNFVSFPQTPLRPGAVALPEGEWYGVHSLALGALTSAFMSGGLNWSSVIGPRMIPRADGGGGLTERRYAIMDRLTTGGVTDTPSWNLSPLSYQWATMVHVFVESLVVDFTADVTSGAAPLTVNFSYTGYGTPDQYRWVFGDGTESTSAAPSHVYAEGTYTVTLYVSRANGFIQQNKTRTAYIVVGAGGGDGGTPTDPRTPYPTQHSLSVLAAAYPVLYAWMNQQPPILTPPLPEPDLTALEVEQEILNLNLLREMVQAISTEQGSSDPVRLSEAVRQMTRVVDGLLYVNQLQMTGDGEYELITGGWSDADAPTSNDLAGDGEVWIEWPSVYRSRRDRMPPDTEDESDPTLWVSVVQDDGSVLWFEVELYPEGWTSLGVTGTF